MRQYPIMYKTLSEERSNLPVIGGVLGLVVAMGIGRFAYTPMLPVMKQHAHFSVTFAGELASWNYFGYFLGAILTSVVSTTIQKNTAFRYRLSVVGLIGSALTTAFMGLSSSSAWWAVLRGLGGLFSAVVLVVSSAMIMDWLAKDGDGQKSGILYSGVGIGIAVTGISVPFLTRGDNWQLGWLGLGGLSIVLATLAILFLRIVNETKLKGEPANRNQLKLTAPFPLWSITFVYGIEGLGYIVMATFITAFFHGEASKPWLGPASWVVVGLAGVPSTWLWTKAGHMWGWGKATVLAFVAQGVGILLPVIHVGTWEAILGSILFGGTFMGITALSLSIGRLCAPEKTGRVIGIMTTTFSVGQVAGPTLAGVITTGTHSYRLAMMLSGLVILAAASLLWVTRKR